MSKVPVETFPPATAAQSDGFDFYLPPEPKTGGGWVTSPPDLAEQGGGWLAGNTKTPEELAEMRRWCAKQPTTICRGRWSMTIPPTPDRTLIDYRDPKAVRVFVDGELYALLPTEPPEER
jgi:hypothetical protein